MSTESPSSLISVTLLTGFLGSSKACIPPARSTPSKPCARMGHSRESWLVLRRVARRLPLHPGGRDPVPPARPTPSRRCPL